MYLVAMSTNCTNIMFIFWGHKYQQNLKQIQGEAQYCQKFFVLQIPPYWALSAILAFSVIWRHKLIFGSKMKTRKLRSKLHHYFESF
jgi:hypothetical protein